MAQATEAGWKTARTLAFRSMRVVTAGEMRPATVLVKAGRIAAVTGWDDVPATANLRDFGDLVLLPGLVDTHVHINDPGRDWEGFETATRAAAGGGVTTVVDMPLNCVPETIDAASLDAKRKAAKGHAWVDWAAWGGVVRGNADKIPELIAAGARGFKCFLIHSGIDGFQWVDEADLRLALAKLQGTGLPLLAHAELAGPVETATAALADADWRSYRTYLASRPDESEVAAIELLIRLAEEYDTPIHIVHLATAAAIPQLKAARERGLPITVETCPQYLSFAAERVPDGATEFKCAPPIRGAANRELLWQALDEGAIDMIATDHSPCPPEWKGKGKRDGQDGAAGQAVGPTFDKAWGGIASLGLALPVIWTGMRVRGFPVEELAQLADWMAERPARLAGFAGQKGALAEGADADLVVFDPEAPWTVSQEDLRFRHQLSPYLGVELRGRVLETYLRGDLVYSVDKFVGDAKGRDLGLDLGRADEESAAESDAKHDAEQDAKSADEPSAARVAIAEAAYPEHLPATSELSLSAATPWRAEIAVEAAAANPNFERRLWERAESVIALCRYLATLSEEPGATTRRYLTAPVGQVHAVLGETMRSLGMRVGTDAAGNLRGLWPGDEQQPSAAAQARLVIGSHIDTVPDAGAFDGVLGVAMALEWVRQAREIGLARPIEVIAFSEEEGVRYGVPFLGSRAVAGSFSAELLELTDADGVSMAEAIRAFGLDPARIAEAELDGNVLGFVEIHIEQGPVLEAEDRSLAVVSGIVGQTRLEMSFQGHANHAGTTPMPLRRDALAGAAEWILAVESVAHSIPGLVATVGKARVSPNAGNVIAALAEVSLDVRHADDNTRRIAVDALVSKAVEIAARRGLAVTERRLLESASVGMDERLTDLLAAAMGMAGLPQRIVAGGAGHDAMVMAAKAPSAMLFLRSPGGISHHPDEAARVEDVANALRVGRCFLDLIQPISR